MTDEENDAAVHALKEIVDIIQSGGQITPASQVAGISLVVTGQRRDGSLASILFEIGMVMEPLQLVNALVNTRVTRENAASKTMQ